jgi:adenylosuccinate lyase
VLLALTQAGMSRENAYSLVQRHAMAVWNGEGGFLEMLQADPEVISHVEPSALARLLDYAEFTRHVETIFARVFDSAGA